MPVPLGLLLTYLLHSSLLLGAVALLRLALGERRLALQEALLRAALVGGFLTVGLQASLGFEPLGGAWHVHTLSAAAEKGMPVTPPAPIVAADAPPASLQVGTRSAPQIGWTEAIVFAWVTLGLLGLARLVAGIARLRRLLHGRRSVADTGLLAHVARLERALGLEPGVPVSEASRLTVPLATGWLRPEVCLPTRVLERLPSEQQCALCAHELAHVARRDPAWLLLARLIEALVPLQPLNFWARRRLQELAECLSDDLAVAVSPGRLGLARSLVDVASWWLPETAFAPVGAASAVSARSRLGHRVERLMDPMRPLERPRRLFLPLAIGLVLASSLITPVIAGREKPAPPVPPLAPIAVPPAAVPAPEPPRPVVKPPRAAAPLAPLAPLTGAVPEPAPAPEPPEVADPPEPTLAPEAPAPEEHELTHLHHQLRRELHRELSAAARPSAAEIAEIESEARELAESLASEASGIARAHVSAREIGAQIRAELDRTKEELRRAHQELARAKAELRRALAEAQRDAAASRR